jgi:hypothetical protein
VWTAPEGINRKPGRLEDFLFFEISHYTPLTKQKYPSCLPGFLLKQNANRIEGSFQWFSSSCREFF